MSKFLPTLLLATVALTATGAVAENTPPAGQLNSNLAVEGLSLYPQRGKTKRIFQREDMAFSIGQYIKGDDGNIYIYNPVKKLENNFYLKLIPDGENRWIFRGRQAFAMEDTTQLYLTRINRISDEETYETLYSEGNIPENSTIGFYFDGDTLKMDQAPLDAFNWPEHFIGAVDYKGNFFGYGLANVKYYMITEEQPAIPSCARIQNMQMKYVSDESEECFRNLQMVTYKDKVFFTDWNNMQSDLWMYGTLVDNKLQINKHYMGPSELYRDPNTGAIDGHHLYAQPATYRVVNEQGWIIRLFEEADKITFDYNADTQKFTSYNPEALIVNLGGKGVHLGEAFCRPVIRTWEEKLEKPLTPVTQSFARVESDKPGVYDREFTFYTFNCDVDSNFIRKSNLSYRIFLSKTDLTPVTFTPEEYVALEKEMTEIPFEFEDYSPGAIAPRDFWRSGDKFHQVYLHGDPSLAGVQLVYTLNGNKMYSDIAWSDGTTTHAAVEEITTNSPVVSTIYYDLQGRRIAQPQQGIFIAKHLLENGSVRTEKILKK